jgi:hypothetical protein
LGSAEVVLSPKFQAYVAIVPSVSVLVLVKAQVPPAQSVTVKLAVGGTLAGGVTVTVMFLETGLDVAPALSVTVRVTV